jgi:hypothetical protein
MQSREVGGTVVNTGDMQAVEQKCNLKHCNMADYGVSFAL